MEASNMDIKTRLEKGKWKLARLAAHCTAGTTQLARLQSCIQCAYCASFRESVSDLFKRETEHLYLRHPIHGIGRDPFRSSMRDVSDGRFYLTSSASP